MKDAMKIKEIILSTIKQRGPSLPVHIAKATDLSILFASAFLSELIAEKQIKTSNLHVGSSPLYLLPGQETQLENFSQHIKGKEKEAFELLKESKILKNSTLEPAIRVALRSIKDFAIPFQKEEEIYWKYFTYQENIQEIKKETSQIPQSILEEIKETLNENEPTQTQNKEVIEENKTLQHLEKKEKSKKIIKKKSFSVKSKKQENKFLDRVKEFLSKDSIEIINIEGLGKNEIILKIKVKDEEQLLIAYNKKKIDEKDIIKSAKKSLETGLKYSILSLGELPKKISELIEALKNIKEIEKIK